MKTHFTHALYMSTFLLPFTLGCGPRPIVEQDAVDPASTVEEPAGVDVQVGGGQGVQVDVNEEVPQQ